MQLFYPSHDIALAHGVRHFNPPAAALRLQEDLAYLADIWNQPFINGQTAIPQPWGWDWDTRLHIHKQYKVKISQLPTDSDLDMIRRLSSRQTTIALIEKLSSQLASLTYEQRSAICLTPPQYIDSEDKLWNFITSHDAKGKPFVLKTPWSSSGRGLILSRQTKQDGIIVESDRSTMMNQALSVIGKMGGIMGEEWLDTKVQDFAMLFYASEQDVKFIGYSLFINDAGTYREGRLLSNDKIVEQLNFDKALLAEIASSYEIILNELLLPLLGHPWHLGYLGIDMLTYHDPLRQTLCLHPSIEINLRCTMGVVCRLWYEQHQREGTFRISPMMNNHHFKAEFLPTE